MANSETIDQIISDRALQQLDDATAKVTQLAKTFNDLLPSVAALNQALGGNQSIAAFNKQLQQAALAQERLNTQLAKTAQQNQKNEQDAQKFAQQQQDRENRLEQQRVNREKAEQNRATKEQERAFKANTAYQQLIEKQKLLNRIAQEQGASFGINSQQFRQAQTAANAVNEQVSGINRGLGNFRDNVGNYASATTGFFSQIGNAAGRAFGLIRTLANIIPNFGIGTAFLLLFEGLKAGAQQLGLFQSKINTFAETLKNLNAVNKATSDEYGRQSTALKYLYAAAIDENNQRDRRLAAARELQKEFPLYFQNINTETILNGGAKKSYDELSASILANAKAKAAENKITELASKLQESDFQKQKIITAFTNEQNAIKGKQTKEYVKSLDDQAKAQENLLNGTTLVYQQQAGTAKQIFASEEAASKTRARNALREQDAQQKSIKDQIKFLEQYAGGATAIGNALSQMNGGPKVKDTSVKDRVAEFNRLIEVAKLADEAIQKDEKSTYQQRFESAKGLEKVITPLIEGRKQAELEAAKVTASGRAAIAKKAEGDINSIKIRSNDEVEKLQAETNRKAEAEYKKQYDRLTDSEKAQLTVIQNAQNARLLEIDDESSEQESKLSKRYTDGLISYKQYQDGLKKIDQEASLARIDAQITAGKKNIETLAAGSALGISNGPELQNALNGYVKLQNDRKKQVTKIYTEETKEREELAKKAVEIEIQTAQQSITFIDDLFKASTQNRLNQLKREENAIDKRVDTEKKAVQRSLLTSKQKADAEALIDARAQSQKEALAARELEVRRQAAVAEKAAAIASVVINTAVAASKVTAQTGIFGIPLVAFVIAQGALQVASILAQPLPAFEKGTDNAPGGYARVSEKGPELVIEPTGRKYLTPETESIINLPAGSRVIPNERVAAMIGKPEHIQYAGGSANNMNELLNEQKQGNKLLQKIADKRNGGYFPIPDARFNDYKQRRFR